MDPDNEWEPMVKIFLTILAYVVVWIILTIVVFLVYIFLPGGHHENML